jgi:apoptosis-inducing factor 1
MFWSDLGSAVGYEAIGRCDSSLETFGVFAKINPEDEVKDVKNEHITKQQVDKSKIQPIVVTSKTNPDADNFTKGVLFYKEGDKIVGILLWNVFNRMSIARKVLMSDEKFTDLNEVAKLFDIFDQHQDQDK